MIELTSKEELDKKFIVMGSFYKIRTSYEDLISCRNLLEIYDTNYFHNDIQKTTCSTNKPDAVFIMMNPGSSSPKDTSYKEIEIPINQLNLIQNNPIILAKSDETQRQLMRLMEIKEWKHIRIINLSDIRLAWGTDKGLLKLVDNCLKHLEGKTLKGLKHKKDCRLYYHPSSPLKSEKQKWLSTILKAECVCTEVKKDNGKIEKKNEVFIHFKDGEVKNITDNIKSISYEKFVELINGIVEQAQDERDFVSTSQTCPLSMMEVGIKKAYIKLVCNFAFSYDNQIAAEEYAEIISLIVRIEMTAEDRLEIRSYMTDYNNIVSNEELLAYLSENVGEGSYDVVKKSLLKDIIYMSRKKEENWSGNQFIVKLHNDLETDDEQVECIVAAIINDEDILAQRKNDSEITKSMKDLASKAGAVGVPLSAIYFSGSIVGVSAAGITSGLASLGMGGLLGFSSMFTGIGVAVLLGVGTYKGVKKFTGLSDLENNKQREMMLQAIIRNSQRSLNYLIEDVNEITKRLQIEIEKGLESEVKIKKISAMISMLTKGAQATSDRIQYAEIEKIISKLPPKLDLTRVIELTEGATKEKIRELILSCYIKKETINEDGTASEYMVLDDKVSCAKLQELHDAFEGIGYFNVSDAAMASVKGAAKNFMKSIRG
ncbi:hypothetical protein [Clostridium thailandense]|uniref:hypothetical protein n=1 Tax=Clostridium thailandense TaxID=2794346 RepID=UPI003988F409